MSTPRLPNHTPVQVNVPDEVHARLKAYAGYHHKRLGELINELLRDFADQISVERAA